MKLGAVFPQTEIGADPIAVRDYAQAVEGMGFDYLLAYEHVVGVNPALYPDRYFVYTHETLFHEPFVLFGYLAGLTRTLEFITGILVLPQRNAVLVAKQAAAVDVLSGGRLRLGVGVGWNQFEMEAQNADFHTRGRRMEEQVQVLRALWTQPLVEFEGRYHHLHGVGINPLPVQRPIPLWFGGGAEAVLRRVAAYGAGWLPNGLMPEQGAPLIERLRGYLVENQRDPAELGLDVRINAARQPKDTWAGYVAGWRALGMTHLCLNTMGLGYTRIDEHLAQLRAFKAEMG